MEPLHLIVEGMSCQHCVKRLKEALKGLQGISDLNVEIGKVSCSYDASKLTIEEIEKTVRKAGYTCR